MSEQTEQSTVEAFAERLGLESKIKLGDDVDEEEFFEGLYEVLSGASKMTDAFVSEQSFIDTVLELAQED